MSFFYSCAFYEDARMAGIPCMAGKWRGEVVKQNVN
jgi:hypothetical protein